MSALRILAFLALIDVSSSRTSDCSYLGLLTHLNLTTSNEVLAVMRPVKTWTTATSVQIDMLLYGILELDEKSQTFTSHIQVQMTWKNEFLTWNSSDFCGINTLTIPTSRLWMPDISIQEDVSDTGSIHSGPLASVYPSGFVSAGSRQRLTSTCQLKLWLFPFDTQNCKITFLSMSSGENAIDLGTLNNQTTLAKVSELIMITQGEWQLKNIKITEFNHTLVGTSQSRLVYTVTIIRKPMLYVVNLIVPLFYLLILDLASFFISEARGEKLSFKVTILLSISVLLLILQDMLPSTEDKLPMIANYCVGIFAMVGISVLEAMLVSFLVDLDGCGGEKSKRSADAHGEIQLEDDCHKDPAGAKGKGPVMPENLPLDGPRGRDLLKLILQEVKAARQEVQAPEKDERKPGCFRRLAHIIDHLFFVLYLLAVVTFLTFMYVEWMEKYIEHFT